MLYIYNHIFITVITKSGRVQLLLLSLNSGLYSIPSNSETFIRKTPAKQLVCRNIGTYTQNNLVCVHVHFLYNEVVELKNNYSNHCA